MNRRGAAVSAVGAAAAAGWMAWAVRGRASRVFGPSVYRGPRHRRSVALTFDDGPSEATPRLLDLLARFGVPVTFFQCGANVERLPDIARLVAGAGHEIGNHSYSHALSCFRTGSFIEQDLERAQRVIAGVTGFTPTLFRAPFGVRWFGMRAAQRNLGLLGVMWTAIGYDWSATPDVVVNRLAGRACNGSILCLHDGRELKHKPDIGVTIESVRRLVPRLLDKGYEMLRVSQLLCPTT